MPPGLQPQAVCSQEVPRKQCEDTQLSLLKAGREGRSHPGEDQLGPSTELCHLTGPSFGESALPGLFFTHHVGLVCSSPDEIPAFQTKGVSVLEKHSIVATGI